MYTRPCFRSFSYFILHTIIIPRTPRALPLPTLLFSISCPLFPLPLAAQHLSLLFLLLLNSPFLIPPAFAFYRICVAWLDFAAGQKSVDRMPRLVARSLFDNRSVIISRIMLRFRPIAPKPVGGEGAQPDQGVRGSTGRRTKRKYVRVRGGGGGGKQYCVRRKKAESKKPSPAENSEVDDASSPDKEMVTLQLLPERSERSIAASCITICGHKEEEDDDDVHRLHRDDRNYKADGGKVSRGSVTEAWIIVERVIGAGADTLGIGFSDKEKMNNLEKDTCPGFVSDGWNKVVWVNEAYKRMVGPGETGFVVWLASKEPLPRTCPAFACLVRLVLQQHGDGGQYGSTKIVPCDVWRMDEFAGFAWKLDLHTALSLSLFSGYYL